MLQVNFVSFLKQHYGVSWPENVSRFIEVVGKQFNMMNRAAAAA